MTSGIRVLVHYRGHADAVRAAYRETSAAMRGVPGLTGHELLESVNDVNAFAVASSWVDLDAFTEWERGNGHRPATAALRPFRDQRIAVPFAIYRAVDTH